MSSTRRLNNPKNMYARPVAVEEGKGESLGIRRHDRRGVHVKGHNCIVARRKGLRSFVVADPCVWCAPCMFTGYQVGDAAERVDKGNTQLRKGIVRQENRRRRCCCLALFGTGALLMAGIVLGSLAGTRFL